MKKFDARAFTLVQLVVVIAIIAVLTALAQSALRAGRERSHATLCLANLRQLAAANLAFAAENNGQFAPAQDASNTLRWHGVRKSVADEFDPTAGPLARYLGAEARTKMCPAFVARKEEQSFSESGAGGYGYNAVYIGGVPGDSFCAERLANVSRPAQTVMFTDTALPNAKGLQEYPFSEPWQWPDYAGRLRGKLSPSVHFRHSEHANVVWCDGHGTSEIASRYGETNRYGGDGADAKIGWFGPEEENGYWNPRRSLKPGP